MRPENSTNTTQQDNKSDNQNVGKQPVDERVKAAHEQAEADMEQDPDLNTDPDPTADLDEGEIARVDNGD